MPPPPPQPARHRLRNGCFGTIVVVVLLVILARLCGGGAAGNGGGSTTAPEATQGTTQGKTQAASTSGSKQKKESRESTVAIGETANVGDSSWVVTSAYPTTQLNDQFGVQPPKQGNFVVVDFDFTNNGNEAKTLSTPIINLYDNQNRKSSPDTDTFGYIPNDKDIFLNQVHPGVTKQGEVIFSVAPGTSGYKLEVADTNYLSTSGEAYVDLGF